MSQGKDFEIQIFTKKYQSQVKKLEENLYLTHRTHSYPKNFKHTETFGSNWVFIFADISSSTVTLSCDHKTLELKNTVAIFVPAFFIIEWTLPEGTYQWECLSSSEQKNFPQELIVFPWDHKNALPKSLEEVKTLLTQKTPMTTWSLRQTKSSLAMKVKTYIDKHYKSELKLSKLSESLGYHRIYLSREFKKTFKISMVEYRHQLRIYEALKLMNNGNSLTEAIFMSGYSSLNQFISYFKKYFLTIPSDYNLHKPKKNQPRYQSLVDRDI